MNVHISLSIHDCVESVLSVIKIFAVLKMKEKNEKIEKQIRKPEQKTMQTDGEKKNERAFSIEMVSMNCECYMLTHLSNAISLGHTKHGRFISNRSGFQIVNPIK